MLSAARTPTLVAVAVLAASCSDSISDCDLDAFPPSYAHDVSHLLVWDHVPVTVAFVADAEDTPARRTYARQGFDTWVAATSGVLDYMVVADTVSADVVVHFAESSTGGGYTELSYDGHTLHHADVRIELHPFEVGRDVVCAAAHEFGHALGIDGHSPDASDLMYVAHYDGTACPVTTRDVDTIRTGYCTLPGI